MVHLLQDRKFTDLDKLGGVSAILHHLIDTSVVTLSCAWINSKLELVVTLLRSIVATYAMVRCTEQSGLVSCRLKVLKVNSIRTWKMESKMILRRFKREKMRMDQIHILRKSPRVFW